VWVECKENPQSFSLFQRHHYFASLDTSPRMSYPRFVLMTIAGNQISRILSFSRFTSTTVLELKTEPIVCRCILGWTQLSSTQSKWSLNLWHQIQEHHVGYQNKPCITLPIKNLLYNTRPPAISSINDFVFVKKPTIFQ
jgi:hypothetical protein